MLHFLSTPATLKMSEVVGIQANLGELDKAQALLDKTQGMLDGNFADKAQALLDKTQAILDGNSADKAQALLDKTQAMLDANSAKSELIESLEAMNKLQSGMIERLETMNKRQAQLIVLQEKSINDQLQLIRAQGNTIAEMHSAILLMSSVPREPQDPSSHLEGWLASSQLEGIRPVAKRCLKRLQPSHKKNTGKI